MPQRLGAHPWPCLLHCERNQGRILPHSLHQHYHSNMPRPAPLSLSGYDALPRHTYISITLTICLAPVPAPLPQFLEQLEQHEYQKAYTVLTRKLKPLEHLTMPDHFKELCYLLTCNSLQVSARVGSVCLRSICFCAGTAREPLCLRALWALCLFVSRWMVAPSPTMSDSVLVFWGSAWAMRLTPVLTGSYAGLSFVQELGRDDKGKVWPTARAIQDLHAASGEGECSKSCYALSVTPVSTLCVPVAHSSRWSIMLHRERMVEQFENILDTESNQMGRYLLPRPCLVSAAMTTTSARECHSHTQIQIFLLRKRRPG